ncbi:cupin domain-containing protein [Nonomuraea jabiensis]|uniref:cupin domain-containing protein n=1 Tax=Nonomuraea jabiensis TaxID=882448 RepID=UPI003D743A20
MTDSMTTKRYTSPDPELDSYYGDLAAKDLQPLWELGEMFTSEPKAAAVPHRWRAADLHELAGRAGDLVPIERGGDRRVIGLANPGLGGAPFIAPSLWAGVQFLLPGELAPPHRHTAAALRFILGGRGAYTVVDGDSIPMTPGDLVLTPGWTVHEHHNPGDEPMVWLDVLDLPLVIGLEALFFEQRPGNPVQRCPARSASEMLYGQSAGLVPVGNQTPAFDGPSSPLTVYRWADTDAALDALLEATSADEGTVRFRDPTRARDVMPTLRCEMTRMRAGATGCTQQQTGSQVGTVLNGSGRVQLAEHNFDLKAGDIFVVPSWVPWQLSADTQLDVFVTSDAPVLEALALFRRDQVEASR